MYCTIAKGALTPEDSSCLVEVFYKVFFCLPGEACYEHVYDNFLANPINQFLLFSLMQWIIETT